MHWALALAAAELLSSLASSPLQAARREGYQRLGLQRRGGPTASRVERGAQARPHAAADRTEDLH